MPEVIARAPLAAPVEVPTAVRDAVTYNVPWLTTPRTVAAPVDTTPRPASESGYPRADDDITKTTAVPVARTLAEVLIEFYPIEGGSSQIIGGATVTDDAAVETTISKASHPHLVLKQSTSSAKTIAPRLASSS